jgi:hypothetical protein
VDARERWLWLAIRLFLLWGRRCTVEGRLATQRTTRRVCAQKGPTARCSSGRQMRTCLEVEQSIPVM